MIKYIFLITGMILFNSCNYNISREKVRNEIFQSEKSFEKMASEKGLAEAFYYFADENAVIKRENETLIKGKENIRIYYEKRKNQNVRLNWTPEFIEVSDCGTLGYTYGKYVFQIWKENADTLRSEGIFHTVWKKQNDGSWKYLWD